MWPKTKNLWDKFSPLMWQVQKPVRYLGSEWGSLSVNDKPQADYHAVMVYPDVYEIGQSNQAVAIIADCLNTDEHIFCERAYLPWIDLAQKMRELSLPLCSLETYAPLSDFDFLGITLPHELAATNILELLDLSQIPLHAQERLKRNMSDPIVYGGGPCTYNPEPFAPFFDAFFIGEGEEVDLEVALLHRKMRDVGANRAEILQAISSIDGMYVPCLYDTKRVYPSAGVSVDSTCLNGEHPASSGFALGERPASGEFASDGSAPAASESVLGERPVSTLTFDSGVRQEKNLEYTIVVPKEGTNAPAKIKKRVVQDFAGTNPVPNKIIPFMQTEHDRLNVEILRGCARGCRFCQAGSTYRPVRERPADQIVAAVCSGIAASGYREVSLTSLSSTDHSSIEQILRRLNAAFVGQGVKISLPSQRVDALEIKLSQLVAGEKRGNITLAPEAATQRMRDIINKGVSESQIFEAVCAASASGFNGVKLYFMLGLPYETDEDAAAIGDLCLRLFQAAKKARPKGQNQSFSISASVALFVPKPMTPFQYFAQLDEATLEHRIEVLRENFPKSCRLNWHSRKTSYIEAALARSGRECAALIEKAWRLGARFDAWTEQFSWDIWKQAADECGLDIHKLAMRTFLPEDVLPWSHISCGIDEQWLMQESKLAAKHETTPDCTFAKCSNCGLCPLLKVKNITEHKRKIHIAEVSV